MAKIKMVIKNIFAVSAITNLLLKNLRLNSNIILVVLVVAKTMSKLVGKTDFERMRYLVHIITALAMFYLGKNYSGI
ncbi:MAG: hypothetical protein GX066_04745 [Clostridiaceae bacterium]|nr:hypothetical protein [Clostridiaceae bacterium]